MKPRTVLFVLLWLLASCTPLAPTTRDLAPKDPSFFQAQVQVEPKNDHIKVYLSPMMTAGQGTVSNLIRCYRDQQTKSHFCQIFAKVETLVPLGERLFSYELDGKEEQVAAKVQKTLMNCGTYCDRLNCKRACYNINLVSGPITPKLLDHLIKEAQLPPESRTPFRFSLKGKGYTPKGELLPAALQGVLLRMLEDVGE